MQRRNSRLRGKQRAQAASWDERITICAAGAHLGEEPRPAPDRQRSDEEKSARVSANREACTDGNDGKQPRTWRGIPARVRNRGGGPSPSILVR